MQKILGSTRNTVKPGVSIDIWLALLSELTDKELTKYGEIARDQRNLEFERLGVQVLCGIIMLLALVVGLREGLQNGITSLMIVCTIVAVILGAWLFQKSRRRRFWNKHCVAVAKEKTRRAAKADAKAG